jgi:hypothetical protein
VQIVRYCFLTFDPSINADAGQPRSKIELVILSPSQRDPLLSSLHRQMAERRHRSIIID